VFVGWVRVLAGGGNTPAFLTHRCWFFHPNEFGLLTKKIFLMWKIGRD